MAQQSGQPVGGGSSKEQKQFPWVKLIVIIMIIAGIILFILWKTGVLTGSSSTSVTISELTAKIKAHNIPSKDSWYVDDYYNILYAKIDGHSYSTVLGANQMNIFLELVSGNKNYSGSTSALSSLATQINNVVQHTAASRPTTSWWSPLLQSMIPTILMVILFIWIFRRMSKAGGGGGMGEVFSGGKNQARKIISKVKFDDVAGQEEVKEDVSEVVDFLKKPDKYIKAGARVPKGIMLGGPPGVGKTLIAKAVAGEAGVPFYFISASNFVEMFAGLGAKRVREMFKEARKSAPAILFIDELDAVGRKRGSSLSGNDEREQTLNQILVEMDGMDENSGLLIIAATNRPDVLDPALLRPGRFDRKITVGLPDIKEREAILRLHAKGKRINKDVDFKNLARRIPRFSGAQIENVINEAALLSVRESSEVINLDHIDEAIDRVNAGPAKKHRIITPSENRMVAVHEAGHAVTGLKAKGGDLVQKITIIPRGDAGGYTLRTPKQEKYTMSKADLEDSIIVSLGGRAAEQVIYGAGEVSTGAYDDIEKATHVARSMVTRFGMSKLGPIAYERSTGPQYLSSSETTKEYSDALAERIDEAIREIIVAAEKKAIELVKKNKKLLNLIVEELIDKETIVYEEIEYINKHLKRPPKKIIPKEDKTTKRKALSKLIEEVDSSKEKVAPKKVVKKTNKK